MSIRGDILDNVKTELEKITVDNKYHQKVMLVEDEKIKAPDELNVDEFPALFIIDTDESKSAGDVNSLECNLEIIVTGYLKSNTDLCDMQEQRRNLQNDVEKALMVDEHRGGKALKTDIVKIITDKGTLEPYAVFDMTVQILYYHDRGNPSSQANRT